MEEAQEHKCCFIKGGPIDHFKHVPAPVSQASDENEYNAACTSGIAISHFIMITN